MSRVPWVYWAGLFLDAFFVGTVAGVDDYLVADVAEEGHAHLCSGLYGSGLEGVGSGVALDAGFGVGDLKSH